MFDINGNKINIGDKVCYIYGKNSDSKLKVGYVTKIYPSKKFGIEEECSVDGNAHIFPYRLMKIVKERG